LPFLDLSNQNLLDPVADNFSTVLHNLPSAFVTLILGLLVVRIMSWIAGWLIGFIRMPKGLKEILGSMVNALLGIFLTIVVLQTLGLNNLAFIFSVFIAAMGIAIGSGSSTLVSDIVGGVYLARDRDFSIGDIVQAGENKVEGEILSMDMRRTRVRDAEGHIHSMPNSVIERKEYTLITKKRDRPEAA
jgi:small-conductance mechanosensitive channel